MTVRCERQRGTTPGAEPHTAGAAAWPADAATFSFEITEITSDVNFLVQHCEEAGASSDGSQAAQPLLRSTIGEVCLPLPLLLAADAAAAARALPQFMRAGGSGGGSSRRAAAAAATASMPPRWARILPPRPPGEPLFDERAPAEVVAEQQRQNTLAPRAPAAALGLLRYEARLTLRKPVAWCYLVPEVRVHVVSSD